MSRGFSSWIDGEPEVSDKNDDPGFEAFRAAQHKGDASVSVPSKVTTVTIDSVTYPLDEVKHALRNYASLKGALEQFMDAYQVQAIRASKHIVPALTAAMHAADIALRKARR